jgi:hypothetical protein
MTLPTAIMAAETLSRMTPEARIAATIRRSLVVTDQSGMDHTVAITPEIRDLCDAALAKAEQSGQMIG